ncbi:MAG TPA: HIT family protein [Anaerolineae bacterium]|nr:HIT family protein [Anaerolineae bacterium]
MIPDQNVPGGAASGTSCIFCDIVRGEAPASRLYADDRAVAFMDIRPVNRGHLLVVPVTHATHLADLDKETGAHLFRIAMRLAAALRASALPCEGINLFLADGAPAGQEVLHVHLHVLPRFRGDGFGFHFPPGYGRSPARTELDDDAASIRRALEG